MFWRYQCSRFQSSTVFQILQYTPETHPDRQNLEDALAKAEELCSQVNEGVRERENCDKLEWMQNHVQCEGLQEVSVVSRRLSSFLNF